MEGPADPLSHVVSRVSIVRFMVDLETGHASVTLKGRSPSLDSRLEALSKMASYFARKDVLLEHDWGDAKKWNSQPHFPRPGPKRVTGCQVPP